MLSRSSGKIYLTFTNVFKLALMFIINRFNASVFRLTSIWMTKTTKRFPFPSEALYQKTAIPIPPQVFLEGDR